MKGQQSKIKDYHLVPSFYIQEGTQEKVGRYLRISKQRVHQVLKKLAKKDGLDLVALKEQAKARRKEEKNKVRMEEDKKCLEILAKQPKPKSVYEFQSSCRLQGLRIRWDRAKQILEESGWQRPTNLPLGQLIASVQSKGLKETANAYGLKPRAIYNRLRRHQINPGRLYRERR